MQAKLTPGFVLNVCGPEAGKDRIIYWDEKRRGFGLLVTAKDKRSFVFQYRNGKGESRRATLSGTTKLGDARKWADILQGEVARRLDPVEKKKVERAAHSKRGKFKTIAEEYVKRERSKLRSMDDREAIMKRLVYPVIGDKVAAKLKRSDIVALLDKVEDENGAAMADATPMVVRRICDWHATRDDEFRTPIVRGMARTGPQKRDRERVLTDEEIRGGGGLRMPSRDRATLFLFAKLLQVILLTAVRRNEGGTDGPRRAQRGRLAHSGRQGEGEAGVPIARLRGGPKGPRGTSGPWRGGGRSSVHDRRRAPDSRQTRSKEPDQQHRPGSVPGLFVSCCVSQSNPTHNEIRWGLCQFRVLINLRRTTQVKSW